MRQPYTPIMAEGQRNYCVLIDPNKYNRNVGCRRHDNRYGVNGGGTERDRWRADMEFYRHMRGNGDPVAILALIACLTVGWFFWNYHSGRWPWRGQLLRRFVAAPK